MTGSMTEGPVIEDVGPTVARANVSGSPSSRARFTNAQAVANAL